MVYRMKKFFMGVEKKHMERVSQWANIYGVTLIDTGLIESGVKMIKGYGERNSIEQFLSVLDAEENMFVSYFEMYSYNIPIL